MDSQPRDLGCLLEAWAGDVDCDERMPRPFSGELPSEDGRRVKSGRRRSADTGMTCDEVVLVPEVRGVVGRLGGELARKLRKFLDGEAA